MRNIYQSLAKFTKVRYIAAALLFTLSTFVSLLPAKTADAATYVEICNTDASRPVGVSLNVFRYSDGQVIDDVFQGECLTFYNGTNDILVDTYGLGQSWRVRTRGADYGACHNQATSDPGSASSYIYKLYRWPNCVN